MRPLAVVTGLGPALTLRGARDRRQAAAPAAAPVHVCVLDYLIASRRARARAPDGEPGACRTPGVRRARCLLLGVALHRHQRHHLHHAPRPGDGAGDRACWRSSSRCRRRCSPGRILDQSLGAAVLVGGALVLAGGVGGGRRGARRCRRRARLRALGSRAAVSVGPDRNLALELVRVTEAAAMGAARWIGRGDKISADQAAVDAMRLMLDTVSMNGVVVIGEGEKDEAPMLYNGEHVGSGRRAGGGRRGRPARGDAADGAWPAERDRGDRGRRARLDALPRRGGLHAQDRGRVRRRPTRSTSTRRRPRTFVA